jgi:1,4-dihydroxy-2-naphthoate octaprenyltransferase
VADQADRLDEGAMAATMSGARLARPGRGSLRERLVAYYDLAKLEIFDIYLTVPLLWSLLTPEQAHGRHLVVLALVLTCELGLVTAACALDDVSGIRDEIDLVNYDDGNTLRKRRRKPLLDQRLTEAEAVRYGYGAAAVGVASAVAAYAVVDFKPSWFPIAMLVVAVCVVGYSWGPKLSYVGGQDLVIIGGLTAAMCLAFSLAAGHVTWAAACEGGLLGLWLMQMTAFGNVNDREGDRIAGRATMAVRLGADGCRTYLLGLYALGWALLVATVAAGVLPWWALLMQLPALGAQSIAVRRGVLGDEPLVGRRVGLWVYRLGWLGLFACNLIVRS